MNVLSAVVMGHHTRMEQAQRLARTDDGLFTQVIVDRCTGAGSVLETARLAWAATQPDATHHLVVQDDALPCRAFGHHVRAAIETMPGRPLAFFTEWGSRTSNVARIAAMRGARWAEVVDDYLPSVALVLPAQNARAFARSCGEGPDDVALYQHLAGVRGYVHVPDLVEHDDAPSLLGNHVMGLRRATSFMNAASPGTGVTEDLPLVPYFSWYYRRADCKARVDGGWQRVPLTEAFTGLLEGFSDSVGSLGTRVDRQLLADLWTVAVALGIVGADGHDATTGTPVAQAALGTLAPGALRLAVPADVLTDIAPELTAFVCTAAEQGIRRALTTTPSTAIPAGGLPPNFPPRPSSPPR